MGSSGVRQCVRKMPTRPKNPITVGYYEVANAQLQQLPVDFKQARPPNWLNRALVFVQGKVEPTTCQAQAYQRRDLNRHLVRFLVLQRSAEPKRHTVNRKGWYCKAPASNPMPRNMETYNGGAVRHGCQDVSTLFEHTLS